MRYKTPSKYNAKLLELAREYIEENGLIQFGGAGIKEYSAHLGINPGSHYKWLEKYPEYAEMVEKAVETYRLNHTKKLYDALMDAALGGYHETSTEDVEYKPNPADASKAMIARKKTHRDKKYFKPDTTAAIFLMTNLNPKDFTNRYRAEVDAKVEKKEELSREAILEELARLEKSSKA